nr:putative sulfate transporter [Quercus suber]
MAADNNNYPLPSSPAAATPQSPRQPPGSNLTQDHRPMIPSSLRQTLTPPSSSPEDSRNAARLSDRQRAEEEGIQPFPEQRLQATSTETSVRGSLDEPSQDHARPDARTSLLGNGGKRNATRNGNEQGKKSSRPRWYGSFGTQDTLDFGRGRRSRYGGDDGASENGSLDGQGESRDYAEEHLGNAITDGLLGMPGKSSATHHLAKNNGVKNERLMYLLYYLPCTNWMRQYRWSYLKGDLIAALTMASFYLPMALSYASNLGHIPPINGLYSFVFNPLIYALLGTCPQMVVGPEAAGSLLTGGVVKEAISSGRHKDHEGHKNAQVAGMVTGLAGSFILAAGLCRLGFLDSVLSRPFLRGFISAIGIVIIVDQLIPEMGLDTAAAHSDAASHGSSLDKMMFLFRHGAEAHKLTCIISFTTIAIVLVLRELKRRLQPRMNWVAYIPDRFAVVVLSAVLAWKLKWASKGVDILGDIKSKGTPFTPEFPFAADNFKHVSDAFGTSFVIALLGFFESSVAAKSLGTGSGKKRKVTQSDGTEVEEVDGIQNVTLSANRELVALGVANMLGGTFMALPAFGGYGRSKVNSSTGGKTPMSSIFLSLITVLCVLFMLPYFYYIPKGTLSAMITVVAYSLIEEAPHDIHFFWKISGYSELLLMFLVFLTTFLWNLRIGIAVGIGLSLLRLLKHSTRPRIQILGRIPGTKEFESAELSQGVEMEFVPHCLIVKIPEPLTFANTGSLKDRLRRLEDHGSGSAHPALPKVRHQEHNQNIIFDIHGVTTLDPAAAQVLLEIVQGYIDRGTRVFFCRIPANRGATRGTGDGSATPQRRWTAGKGAAGSEVWRLMVVSGIVELCGGEGAFLRSVDEALRATERANTLASAADEELDIGVASGSRTEGEGVGDEVAAIQSRITGKDVTEEPEELGAERRHGDGVAAEHDPIAGDRNVP